MLKDFIGRDLAVGDLVACADLLGGGMMLGRIERVTQRQVICEPLTKNNTRLKNITKYAEQCVKLNDSEVTMYLLTRKTEE